MLYVPLRTCLEAVVHDGRFETEYADMHYLMLIVCNNTELGESVITNSSVHGKNVEVC